MRTRYRLQGKVVLITGGSRGLGLCLAREFARQGAALMLLARDGEELARAAHELTARGAKVRTLIGDVRLKKTADQAIAETIREFGRLDVLVNNAGIIKVAPLDNLSDADFGEAMETHFWGPLHFMRAAVPFLRNTRGRIVNISSVGGLVAIPHLSAYSASKFALTGLSDAFRAELAPEGIKVTTVCPGLMRTGSHIQAKFKGHTREEFRWFALSSATPLTSMSAERAASQIVSACRLGAPHLTLSIQARLLHLGSVLLPSAWVAMVSGVNRILPASRPGTEQQKGGEIPTDYLLKWLTGLLDRASRKNNEIKTA